MELRHLRYFIAVAEEENVTRAAARLHVSQPPLSRQIHDLEDELGIELFERTGKSVRLTDAGRIFLVEAKAALQRVDQAVAAVRAVVDGKQTELNLGYAPSPTVGMLPAVLRELRGRFPGMKINLFDLTSTEMIDGLCKGTLHASLMVEPMRDACSGIIFEEMCAFPFVVAVAPGHPFTKLKAVKLADVLREPIVAYSRKEYPDYFDLLERTFQVKSKQLRLVEECDSGMSLIAAVESGRGIAISASSISDTAGERLEYIRLQTPSTAKVVVGLSYRKSAPPRSMKVILEAIRSAVAKLPRKP